MTDPENFEQVATLCYVIEDGEVLLIYKKRGVGEGLYNGPGGKIEEHDDGPREAAVREVREEVCIDVENLEKVGELQFFFGNTPFMHVHAFKTSEYRGEPEETDEARPEWFPVDAMPYDQMWEDDRYWMPKMFDGKKIEARFEFDEDGDELEDWEIEEQQNFPNRK